MTALGRYRHSRCVRRAALTGFSVNLCASFQDVAVEGLAIARRNRNKKITLIKPSRDVRNIIDVGTCPSNKHSMISV